MTRGVAGSRAVVHSLDPSTYPPGDDGSREALIAYSRRVYDPTRQIECALYRFKMSDSNPHSIESVLWAWYGYLGDVPKCSSDNKWSIPVKHFTQALSDFEVKASEPVELSHCVFITDFSSNVVIPSLSNSDFDGVGPNDVTFRFTAYEFERVFNIPARTAQTSRFGNSTLLSTISGLFTQDSRVYFEIVGEVGGYTWVWRVTSIGTADANSHVMRVSAVLKGATKGAKCNDNPVQYSATASNTYARSDGLNQGFVGIETAILSGSAGTNHEPFRVRIDQDEAPPKVYARVRLSAMSFTDAALTIMMSGFGDASNDTTYDLIPGFRGLNFNPNWVNIGTASGAPLSVSAGTMVWLEHGEIDPERYNYALVPGTKIGDWFRNELLLRNMILAFVPSTGKIAPRIWARSDSYTALNPVSYPETPIEYNETLKEQRVIFLERGIDSVTLDAKFRKPLQDPEARILDYKSAPTVRIWKDGGKITDEELQSGNLALFLRACFGVGVGAPRIFAIPTALDSGITFGDLVTWTDPLVPTSTGLGFTTRKLIVLGIDPNPNEGVLYVYCVEDLVNLEQTQSGTSGSKTGSALGVVGVVDFNETNRTATLEVDAHDYTQGFRIDTSDGAIWEAIKNAGGYVVVRSEIYHNPTDTEGERQGYQEIYATVTGTIYDSGARKSYIALSWTAAMAATRGVTAENVMTLGSVVQLPDYRQPTAAPSGVLIEPIVSQGYDAGAGANIAHISAISRRPRFDSNRSILGA